MGAVAMVHRPDPNLRQRPGHRTSWAGRAHELAYRSQAHERRPAWTTAPTRTCARRVLRKALRMPGLVRTRERARRVHQRHVGERLWEVADEPARGRVIFFSEQPDVVANREQPLEESARLVFPPDEREAPQRNSVSRTSVSPR